jgi:DNA-binding transcriptional LysR family regulator
MDLLDFSIFRLLYLCHNTTEVARQQYLSTPAVSYRLSKMQEEIGVDLYTYNGKYHFTDEGKKFFDACESILGKYEETVSGFDKRGAYMVSLSTAAAHEFAPSIFSIIKSRGLYPVIMTGDSMTAIKDVLEGISRFAVVGGINIRTFKKLRVKELKTENIVFMYPERLVDDIAIIPVLLDEPRSGLHSLEKEYLNSFPATNVVGEAGLFFEKLLIAAKAGAGCFIPETALDYVALACVPGMVKSRLYGFQRTVYLAYREEEKGDVIIGAMLNELEDRDK